MFAAYSYDPSNQYPLCVEATNLTYNTEIGGAEICVLEATQNAENLDRINFISSITVNLTALEAAGVFNISCGRFMARSTISFTYRQGSIVI